MTEEQFEALKRMIEAYAYYAAMKYGGEQRDMARILYEKYAEDAKALLVIP